MSEIVYFSNGTGQWEEDTAAGGEVAGGSGGGGGGGGGAPNIVTVTNPGAQSGAGGAAVSLQIIATDSDPAETLIFTATGLPSGLSISASGLITGNLGSGGSFFVTVTATDSTGVSSSVSFSWTVTGANTVTVSNPGPQSGLTGDTINLQISASDSASGQTLTFTATGLPPALSISTSGKITGSLTTVGSFSNCKVTATDTTGAFGTVTFGWTVGSSGGGGGGSGLLAYLGYTPGQGTGETGPGNLTGLAGWQAAYQRTGPGAPTGTGRPYALCTKVFDPQIGYPNFPSAWGGNPQNWASNNGGIPLVPIIVFDNVPSTAAIVTFLKTLPSGQKFALQYQSEHEGGISASTFVANWRTISLNLNAALQQMGGGSFWNRANFPMVSSSLADYYSKNPGSTAFFQDSQGTLAAHMDSPGIDLYHRNLPGSGQSVPVNQDARFNGWISAVHKIFGANVPISFPEYGISFANNTYSASNEQARADLMKADWNYMTGSSRPSGTKPMMFWNYWYQMDTQYHFCFPLADGTETVQQAGPTIAQWQSMLAKAG